MEKSENRETYNQHKSLRLWPGVLMVTLQWIGGFILPAIFTEPFVMMIGVLGSVVIGIGIIIWWLFFSRAARIERGGALILMIITLFTAFLFLDNSIATGNMGLMFILYSVPVMSLAFVIWSVVTRGFSNVLRRITLIITILFASFLWLLLRSDGINGEGRPDFNWRWAQTPEERLLKKSKEEPFPLFQSRRVLAAGYEWPGFRGINRDGVVHGTRIKTDWSVSPPVEIWRRPVGPGCSSVTINGNLIYTQEQHGEYEVVSCYDLYTGQPVWKHSDKTRFYDSHAGAGPRSTPTLKENRVYALGATGIFNVLDASKGTVLWSRNAAKDAGIEPLTWGFTSSPLLVGNVVIIALSGKLAAYDTTDGKPIWFGIDGGASYSSPQLLMYMGAPQVLLMSASGAVSVEPATGNRLWNYPWPSDDRILQPAFLDNDDLLLSQEIRGLRRISLIMENGVYSIKERWTTTEMNVNFNDHVIHKGYLYGFDGPGLACMDLKDGKRLWKGNRYRGWILLLADQDLLLILSEKGEVALVPANPERFSELSKFQAIRGKTWNHPAMAGNLLIVRNASEMAAFRLPQ